VRYRFSGGEIAQIHFQSNPRWRTASMTDDTLQTFRVKGS